MNSFIDHMHCTCTLSIKHVMQFAVRSNTRG
uniref:Uncharacterized protein n=1 Tax=Rhizophora mucronata TaxID=61149 RepID=A0A2P2MXE4_RHIMU